MTPRSLFAALASFVAPLALAAAPPSPSAGPVATRLVGTWSCQGALSPSSATETYRTADDGALALENRVRTSDGRTAIVEETFRYDARAKRWSLTAPANPFFDRLSATGPEPAGDAWTLTGTQSAANDSRGVRIVYTFVDENTFRRAHQTDDRGRWHEDAAYYCRRAPSQSVATPGGAATPNPVPTPTAGRAVTVAATPTARAVVATPTAGRAVVAAATPTPAPARIAAATPSAPPAAVRIGVATPAPSAGRAAIATTPRPSSSSSAVSEPTPKATPAARGTMVNAIGSLGPVSARATAAPGPRGDPGELEAPVDSDRELRPGIATATEATRGHRPAARSSSTPNDVVALARPTPSAAPRRSAHRRPRESDRGYALVGSWACRSMAGAPSTHAYRRANDGSIVLRNVLTIAGRDYAIAETYRKDRATGRWTNVTQHGSYRGTAPPWVGDSWTFEGPETDAGPTRTVRMTYTAFGADAFRRDFAREAGAGTWVTFTSETCRRS